jgi:hypothetical protein
MVKPSRSDPSPDVVIEISSRPSLEMLRKVSSQPDTSTATPSSAPPSRAPPSRAPRPRCRPLPFCRTPNHLAEGSRIP